MNLADSCLPLLNSHLGQLYFDPALGSPFPFAVYILAFILPAVVTEAILPKVIHADTTTSATVVSVLLAGRLQSRCQHDGNTQQKTQTAVLLYLKPGSRSKSH